MSDININKIVKNPFTFINKLCWYKEKRLTNDNLTKQCKRLIEHFTTSERGLSCAPRTGSKSFAISLACIYYFITKPGFEISIVSLRQRHTNRIMRKIRTVINESPELKACVPDFETKQKQQLIGSNEASITAYPGISESVIGDHPNLLFIDEASQHPPGERSDRLYYEVLIPTQVGGAMEFEETKTHLVGTWGRNIGFAAKIYEGIKTNRQKGLKYTLLDMPWYECEGYTKEQMDALKEEMGEFRFLMNYGGAGFLSGGYITIDPMAIPRNIYTIDELQQLKIKYKHNYEGLFNPDAPTWIGVDPGKEVHKTGIVVMQENNDHYVINSERTQFPKYKIVDWWVGQPLNYEEVYDKVEYFYNTYNTQGVVVDSTGVGNAVKDAILNRGMPCEGVCFGGERGKRETLFSIFKSALESIDENKRGRLIIPDTYEEVINAIKHTQLDKHLPDLAAASCVLLYVLRKNEGRYSTGETHYETIPDSENEFIKLGIPI